MVHDDDQANDRIPGTPEKTPGQWAQVLLLALLLIGICVLATCVNGAG